MHRFIVATKGFLAGARSKAATRIAGLLLVLVLSSPSFGLSESWTCKYPGFGANRELVIVTFIVKNDKLVSARFGVPQYAVLANNQYALIAVEHYSQFDAMKGAVRIYSATIIIDKTLGQFIYMVGEIGEEPGYAKGSCTKDLSK